MERESRFNLAGSKGDSPKVTWIRTFPKSRAVEPAEHFTHANHLNISLNCDEELDNPSIKGDNNR